MQETAIYPITLTELSNRIQGALNRYFAQEQFWIVAEISGHKFYPNNDRHYFDFIEKAEGEQEPRAKIRGISWFQGSQAIRNFEQQTGQQFANGLQVLCRVKIEYHAAHGLSLIVQDIDVSFTLGNLEKQRRQTLEKLVRDNPEAIVLEGDEYITTNKRAKLPVVIQDIAVIGSPNSEGFADFMHTITENQHGYSFRLYNFQTSVQGVGAETEIISTLIEIHNSKQHFDCIVIIRGGGAKTDFIVFDQYRLARAVARFPIPVITGIGHHKDVSIVDMMAHTSTKTPTKAAEFIIAYNRSFEERLTQLQKNLVIRIQQKINLRFEDVHYSLLKISSGAVKLFSFHREDLLFFRKQLTASKTRIVSCRNEVDQLSRKMMTDAIAFIRNEDKNSDTLNAAVKVHAVNRMQTHKNNLKHYASFINMMHPHRLLKKGFALIMQNGKIKTSAEQLDDNSELKVVMHDGTVKTKITSINNEERTEL